MRAISILIIMLFSIAFSTSQIDLESAFDSHYEISEYTSQASDDAIVQLENSGIAYFPKINLSQIFGWQNFQTASLQVNIGISYNILDAKRDLQMKIAQIGETMAEIEKKSEKTQALYTLRTYIQALSTSETLLQLLSSLEIDVRKARPNWLPETPANKFAPNEIEPYLKFLELMDTRKSVITQAERIKKQISKWTKINLEELSKLEFPGDVMLPEFNSQQCVSESITVKRAQMRLEQEKLFEAVRNDASPTLGFTASATATTNPAAGQSPISGQASLTLNIPIGPNSPVTGGNQVVVTPLGITQTANLVFPNPFRSADPQGVKWALKNLEDATETVKDNLTELQRTRTDSMTTLKLDKQRLDWGERSYKDSLGTDELVRLSARFALMGLKVRAMYDHMNYQINGLNISQLCQLKFAYVPRDPAFGILVVKP
jgi:hypothetical protein